MDPAQYPARAARQWIPPSIRPERLPSGSRRVSRQSGFPVDPAQYPARAARQWITPSIPPEQLDSGTRQVFGQSGSPVHPAEYPARAAFQWIPPSIPPERLANGSRRVSRQSSWPVDPSNYPARAARQRIPPSGSRYVKAANKCGPCQPSCLSVCVMSVSGRPPAWVAHARGGPPVAQDQRLIDCHRLKSHTNSCHQGAQLVPDFKSTTPTKAQFGPITG